MELNLHSSRKQYTSGELNEANLPTEPTDLFLIWYHKAEQLEHFESNAMVLSTVSDGKPSSRIVLLKEVTNGRFIFFTNYESRKGREIGENNAVALNFFWQHLQRQIRIEGTATRIPESDSEQYFNERPLESRISAIVSPQSSVISSREILEANISDFVKKNASVAKPSYWGGYAVTPLSIEFWQGRPNRLHDRIRYLKTDNGWQIDRLAP
jgi:pyridoxamine 5'-phosphate oxidase